MEPGPVSYDVLYMQDEHRSAQIDASRVIVYVFEVNNSNIIILNFFY